MTKVLLNIDLSIAWIHVSLSFSPQKSLGLIRDNYTVVKYVKGFTSSLSVNHVFR